MKKLSIFVLSTVLLAATPSAQDTTPIGEQSQWFVLRDGQTGDCQPAVLILVQGMYRHGSALLAGGPYKTEAEATARIQALANAGTCIGK